MKVSSVIQLLSPLLLLSPAGVLARNCCTKCRSINDAAKHLWITPGSKENQTQVVVSKVCPTAQDTDSCENELPGFWKSLALALWPALLNYESSLIPYSPHVEDWCWMEDQVIDESWCTSCPQWMGNIKFVINYQGWGGIQKTQQVLKGAWFCDGPKNPFNSPPQDHDIEVCQNILTLILEPAIRAWFNSEQFTHDIQKICQDSCPPTPAPTDAPTAAPTDAPTAAPTDAPTAAPTDAPTAAPTDAPTAAPTDAPTAAPTDAPTAAPTDAPTAAPTDAPTDAPTAAPTDAPSAAPTDAPTTAPTDAPTATPTTDPTDQIIFDPLPVTPSRPLTQI